MRLGIIISFLIILGCKKSDVPYAGPIYTSIQNGLPPYPTKINGYFYASNGGGLNWVGRQFILYSTFSDDPTDLMKSFQHHTDVRLRTDVGNISVGPVMFDTIQLSEISSKPLLSYNRTKYIPNPDKMNGRWSTGGNGSFEPLGIDVSRGFPEISDSIFNLRLRKASDLVIELKDLVQNYDSIVMMFIDNIDWRQAIAFPSSTISFPKDKLAYLFEPGANTYLFCCAYNYSYSTVNDKMMVFGLSTKVWFKIKLVE